MDPQQLINAILMAAAFGLVFSAWSICVMLWIFQYVRRQRQVRKRLGLGGPEAQQSQALQLWRDGYEAQGETSIRRIEMFRNRDNIRFPMPYALALIRRPDSDK